MDIQKLSILLNRYCDRKEIAKNGRDVKIILQSDPEVLNKIMDLEVNDFAVKCALESLLYIERDLKNFTEYKNDECVSKKTKELAIIDIIKRYQSECDLKEGYKYLTEAFKNYTEFCFDEMIDNIFKYCKDVKDTNKLKWQLQIITNGALYSLKRVNEALEIIDKMTDKLFYLQANYDVCLNPQDAKNDNKLYVDECEICEYLKDLTDPENENIIYYVIKIYTNNKFGTIELKEKVIRTLRKIENADCRALVYELLLKQPKNYFNTYDMCFRIINILNKCENIDLYKFILEFILSVEHNDNCLISTNDFYLLLVEAFVLKDKNAIIGLNNIINSQFDVKESLVDCAKCKLTNAINSDELYKILCNIIDYEKHAYEVSTAHHYILKLNDKLANISSDSIVPSDLLKEELPVKKGIKVKVIKRNRYK